MKKIKNEKGISNIITFIILVPAVIFMILMLTSISDMWFKKHMLTKANDMAVNTIIKRGAEKGTSEAVRKAIASLQDEAKKKVDIGGFDLNITTRINGVISTYTDDTLASLYNKVETEGLGRNDTRQDYISIEIISKNPALIDKVIRNSVVGWFGYNGSKVTRYQSSIGGEIEQWLKE